MSKKALRFLNTISDKTSMRKSLIAINISALLLTSCANFTQDYSRIERLPAAEELSCNEMIKAFFKKKNNSAQDTITFKSKTGLDIDSNEAAAFFKQFKANDLSDENSSTIKAIYLFSKDNTIVKKNLLDEFELQLKGSAPDETNKTWMQFTSHKKKVDSQKKKFQIKEKADIYEKLYYNCKTQIKSSAGPGDLKQAKRLTYAITTGGFASAIATYSTVHWEEEKNSRWFNELYFTLGVSLVLTYFSSKFLTTNANLNPWTGKLPLTLLTNAFTDVGVSALYASLFGVSDAELTKKLQILEADPKAQEKLQELLKIAQDEHLFEKHLKNTQDMFKDKSPDKKIDREITFNDIDLEASRDLFIAALAEKEYQEKSGIINTGGAATDRFTYHRLYNLLSTPTSIGLSIVMYNQMCMSESPKKGFMKAVGTYMAVSVLFDALYFKGRKDLINQ
jgi:hypothetical protein